MKLKMYFLSVVMAGAFALPAVAHHSFAMFNRDKTVELQGTVKDFQWSNPHTFMDVYVDNPKGGAPILWTLEFGALHSLADQGWRPKTVLPGDKISFTVHPAKDGSAYGQPVSVTLPNGKIMGQGGGVRPGDAKPLDN
jgi:hypothetical protein